MKNGIVTYIVDNDAKGKTGVGTIFGADVTVNGVTTLHQWSLMDWINNKVDPEAWFKPVVDAMRVERERDAQEKAENKACAQKEREASVVISNELAIIVNAVIFDPSSQKAITEYKQGKEKAINALVGKVIKTIKEQSLNIDPDAFVINRAIVKVLH